MPGKLGWVRQFHQPELPESLPLLLFPHAGAGASAYRAFSKLLSANFDVIVFQYP
jgi:surfactin synthase thioesterase subunit